jgi:hypothetical protein
MGMLSVAQSNAATHRLLAGDAASKNWKTIKHEDGSEELVNTATGERISASGGAGALAPGQYPQKPNPKATEDERRTAYQTDAVVGRASRIDPASANPGVLESLARTALPGEVGESVANFVSSSPRQIARQSQEGTIDALLWLSTGAAYNKEQLTQARREYLPGWGDDPATVTMKKEKLGELMTAARNRAGRAWTQAQEDRLHSAFPEYFGGPQAGPAPSPGAQAPGSRVEDRARAELARRRQQGQ